MHPRDLTFDLDIQWGSKGHQVHVHAKLHQAECRACHQAN